MRIAILFAFAIANICFAAARPYHLREARAPWHKISKLNENAVIELINIIAQDTYEKGASDEPEEDEEEIDEKIGISSNPNMIGDLVLTPEQKQLLIDENGPGDGKAQGFKYTVKFWTNGLIPYELDNSLNYRARASIRQAMEELSQKSCIRFVLRTNLNFRMYPNCVYFTPGNGCHSNLGMIGGRQTISIGRGCEYKGIVQHEILHALGRIHEQSRLDRDQYVQINLNNVQQGLRNNFLKMRSDKQGFSYDYGSVMHYGRNAFSINGLPTITPRQRGVNIGQRRGLSVTDWNHIRKAYCSSSEMQQAFLSSLEQ